MMKLLRITLQQLNEMEVVNNIPLIHGYKVANN